MMRYTRKVRFTRTEVGQFNACMLASGAPIAAALGTGNPFHIMCVATYSAVACAGIVKALGIRGTRRRRTVHRRYPKRPTA
jgi:hypothetical protein